MIGVSRGQKTGFTIAAAVLGAVVGLLIGMAASEDNVVWPTVACALVGGRIGSLIFHESNEEKVEPPGEKEEPYYSLPEEMRDGYHEQLVMKRIMEIYHPEGDPFEDEDEVEDEEDDLEEEGEADEGFLWIGLDRDK